jgi:curved DNA-binding protein CbpA
MAKVLDSYARWADEVLRKNYYEILRLGYAATGPQIKAAWHAFALRFHPDRLVDEGPEVARASAEIFKRGVEAYGVLSRPDLRKRYDDGLRKGAIRLDLDARPAAPPAPAVRTLEMIATTPSGKKLAARADRLIAIGKLEDARVQLTGAYQQEPENEELAERITMLYEAMALEPG